MSYSILFSLRIRLLSPEFFSSGLRKGLCEGLWTKRFTATRNLTCKREHLFPCIFTSTPVNQCLSHSAVKLSLVKIISYRIMADRKNLRDDDIKYELVCDNDSDENVEDTQSIEHEDRLKNNHPCSAMKTLRSTDCCLSLIRHISISL